MLCMANFTHCGENLRLEMTNVKDGDPCEEESPEKVASEKSSCSRSDPGYKLFVDQEDV